MSIHAKKIGHLYGLDVCILSTNGENHYVLMKNYVLYCWIKTKNTIYGELVKKARTSLLKGHLIGNLLFWLKSYLNKNLIFSNAIGDKNIKWLAKTGRFKMSWLNTKTGKKQEYKTESECPGVDWRIFIEAFHGDFFVKFFTEGEKWHVVGDLFTDWDK